MSVPQSKCAHAIVRADHAKNLFGAPQLCATLVPNKDYPYEPEGRGCSGCAQWRAHALEGARTVNSHSRTHPHTHAHRHICKTCHAMDGTRCTTAALQDGLFCKSHESCGPPPKGHPIHGGHAQHASEAAHAPEAAAAPAGAPTAEQAPAEAAPPVPA